MLRLRHKNAGPQQEEGPVKTPGVAPADAPVGGGIEDK